MIGDAVFQIRFECPERMNALGVATVDALREAIAQARRRHAKVVLFRGSGRAFCAGADLKERKGMNLEQRLAHNAGIRAALEEIADASFVSIAVLNGLALGGGLELALACDMRLTAPALTLGLTESRVGAFPGAGGTQRLPRLIGSARALQMMLSGEPVTSEYALEIGLVNEIVAADQLDERAREMAALISSRSGRALAEIKRLVYRGLDVSLENGLKLEREALPAVLGSADYAEGLAAFEERREPRFTETAQ
ncbi:enoyl-CoA hydratase-related protein [Caballeronia sp. GAWG2-1]|uniref:enoyl-CoA hydratase/isomerase family protein n=1 Tax=Caballeronia sp. GAWG2-1 TaxID=2921744 RepID=UPI0020292CA4